MGQRGETPTKKFKLKYGEEWLVLKKVVVEKYGGECKCCGERHLVFLTLDHLKGDGADHRKRLCDVMGWDHNTHVRGWAQQLIYEELAVNPADPTTYQILCMNCNHATRHKKICPHNSTSGKDAQ